MGTLFVLFDVSIIPFKGNSYIVRLFTQKEFMTQKAISVTTASVSLKY